LFLIHTWHARARRIIEFAVALPRKLIRGPSRSTRSKRIVFVTASHKPEVLEANLLKSGIFRRYPLIIQRGYTNVAKAYNEARARADVVVYLHHDVFLPDDFEANLLAAIADIETRDRNWGVLGVAGVVATPTGKDLFAYLFDRGHILEGVGPLPNEVETLDELILITHGDFTFDETLGNHFYGADICLQARLQSRKSYAISAYLHHNCGRRFGEIPPGFDVSRELLRDKYRHLLPIATTCTRIEPPDESSGRRLFIQVPRTAGIPMRLRHHPGISADDLKATVRVLAVKVAGCGSDNSVIRSGDAVEIAVTLVANAAVEGVLIAFHIYNHYGQLLFSSGTKRHDQGFSVSAGNTYRVAFRMPMNLAPGSYSVSTEAGCEASGERLLFHFLEDAASFDVQSRAQGSFRGIVDLRPAVSVQPDPGLAETYHVGDTIRFSAGGESDRYARSGWAIAEDCGRWTVREEAHLLMRLDRQPDICLAVEAALFPFCPEQRPNLEVEVLINGHSIDTWRFTAPGSIERRQMAVSAQVTGTLTHILFRIREPVVPAHLGISSDTRALGLAMIELRLVEHPWEAP
jgi:hypothetical protein